MLNLDRNEMRKGQRRAAVMLAASRADYERHAMAFAPKPQRTSLWFWSLVMLAIGVAAFIGGMAVHNQVKAAPMASSESIYYCATGVELPAFEPCKARKSEMGV